MRKPLWFLLAFSISPSLAEAGQSMTVKAKESAEIAAKPDIVFITLVVSSSGMLTVDAEASVNTAAQKIVGLIEQQHKKATVTVAAYKTGAKSQGWRAAGEEPPPRPEVSKRLLITFPFGAAEPAAVIDLALRNGAAFPGETRFVGDPNSVVFYGIKEAAQAEKKAEQLAFERATERAKALAATAGRTIGSLRSLVGACGACCGWENRDSDLPVEYKSVSADGLKVDASVEVEYELK